MLAGHLDRLAEMRKSPSPSLGTPIRFSRPHVSGRRVASQAPGMARATQARSQCARRLCSSLPPPLRAVQAPPARVHLAHNRSPLLSWSILCRTRTGSFLFFEPLAKLRALTSSQRVMQDDDRRSVVFYDYECLGKGPHRHDSRTGICEGICNVQCDQGPILANEDRATIQAGAAHARPLGAAKRKLPEAGAASWW
jgi:hypothetical protein